MSFIATFKFEDVSYSRVKTKMALSYLLGLALRASCFLLFAFRRNANITIKMMISRPQSPPIKADNCVPESPLPPSDSGDLLKLVSLFKSEAANKIKVNVILSRDILPIFLMPVEIDILAAISGLPFG